MSGRGNGRISSSSALIRISANDGCDLAAAMALEQASELETFKALTGSEYKGEYGIRPSLVRRGAKFENNNHTNDAMALRKRVAEMLHVYYGEKYAMSGDGVLLALRDQYADPEHVLVRDLDKEEPVVGGDLHVGNLRRYRKTQGIVKEAYRRKKSDVPDLVIHPTFELPFLTGPDGKPITRGSRYLNPDFMVLDRVLGVYLIGDEKSFIVRDDTVVDSSKLDKVRRQIASGTLAMRYELQRLDPNAPIITKGLLVFATPYGLSAARIASEDLSGEIQQVQKAIPQLQRVALLLAKHRRTQPEFQFFAIAATLGTNLKESCYGRCLLTEHCELRRTSAAQMLGRDTTKLLGGKLPAELSALAAARGSITAKDAALLDSIEQAAAILGLPLATYLQDIA